MGQTAKRMRGAHASRTFMEGGVALRTCVFCGETKPLVDHFARNGQEPDGTPSYRRDCKVCYNIRRKENNHTKKHSDFLGAQRRRGEVSPSLTHQEWKECVMYFGGECAYCGATPRRNRVLTKDHLWPVSLGGLTTPDNVVPACDRCNSSKGASEWREWLMRQEFFSQERMNRIFKWRSIQQVLGGSRDAEYK